MAVKCSLPFEVSKPIIGVIHLLPLPGSPRGVEAFEEVYERCMRDAQVLREGGVDGIIVENYGDAPFHPECVPPHVIAALAICAARVKEITNLPVGVNVLRNDAMAAIGIAATANLDFVRINVHSGVAIAPEGILIGRAHETLRYRKLLNARCAIWADVRVKHAVPISTPDIQDEVADLVERNLADALIVSGARTGSAPSCEWVKRIKAVASCPVLIGSGVTVENLDELLSIADGAIVATAFKMSDAHDAHYDKERIRKFMKAVERLRTT